MMEAPSQHLLLEILYNPEVEACVLDAEARLIERPNGHFRETVEERG